MIGGDADVRHKSANKEIKNPIYFFIRYLIYLYRVIWQDEPRCKFIRDMRFQVISSSKEQYRNLFIYSIVLLIPETLKVPGALRQAWPILGPVSGIGVGVGISILPTLLS